MIESKKNVRNHSFNILMNVFYKEKLLNKEIDYIIDSYDINDSDKSFIKKECTGVFQNLELIDSIINKYSKVKANKLKNDILIVFRLSIYEFLYMDKVPEYATINEFVKLIKKTKYKNLSGYVNATLKNIFNNEIANKQDSIADNNKKYCYFIIVNNKDSVLSEFNNRSIDYFIYDGLLDFKYVNVYYANNYKDVIDSDSFKNGNIIIQDASSAYLVEKIFEYTIDFYKDKNTILNILDTCSAPGGKILSLYSLISENYSSFNFEARDISEEKIKKIKNNLIRLKINDINLRVIDATKDNCNDYNKYDLVICDVPCSGIGVINKKPDIKLRINDEKINSLQKIQRSILNVSKNYVKQGGLLSYSTCTETKDENENNANYFLENNKNFEKLFEKNIISNDDNKCDGFYMCIFRKL